MTKITGSNPHLNLLFFFSSGGLSNHIFYCSLPSDATPRGREPTRVLLRLYGATDDDLQDHINAHVIDNVVFTILSERGLGPTLYGVFPEGR